MNARSQQRRAQARSLGSALPTSWFSAAAAARIVYSRLYLCVDVLWLAVEEAAVLSCAEQLFPGLISQRSAASVAAVLSGAVWLLFVRRLGPQPAKAASAVHAAAVRAALSSVLWRSLLVMLTTASLGLLSTRQSGGAVPLHAVAFLLWGAAAGTPLCDAGRALLEYGAAMHTLDEERRRAAAGTLQAQKLHGLAWQLHRDTLPIRALLLCLAILGLYIACGLPLLALALSALPAANRLAPLLFAGPALLLCALSVGIVYVQVRLYRLTGQPARTGDAADESTATLRTLLWLPRGLAGTTLIGGALIGVGCGLYARLFLAVPAVTLFVAVAVCTSGLAATAIAQWALVRLLCDSTRDVLQRSGPFAMPLHRMSPAASLRKARRAIGWATVAVLSPPLSAIVALWLQQPALSLATRLALLFAAALVLLLSLFTTLRRLRSALRPLSEATRQAAALAADPDDVSAAPDRPAHRSRRRTRLAMTLQAMQEALRQRLVSSSQAQARLEAEVAERTRELLQRNLDIEQNIRLLSQAQAALSEAEKLATIGQFVAGIAHEINNPINAALNAARPLREALGEILADSSSAQRSAELLADSELAAMLRVVQRGTQRAEEIVRALFNYAESQAQLAQAIDIHRTLDDAWELLQHPAKSQIQLRRRDEAKGRVQSYGGQLQQVFVNLLGNALHALLDQALPRPDYAPVIDIHTSDDGALVRISIRDNGPGIPRALHTRIFEPFFTTKDPTQGSGLGLAIAHSIVTRHRGRIELTSAPGQGARFVVVLPAAPASSAP